MKKVKTNPGQKLVIGLMRLFSLMPLKWHHKFSAFFSWVMKDIMHYREDVVTTNIARSFPEMKYNELKEVKKKFYRHFGDIITEAIWFSGKTGRKGCEKLHRQHVLEFKNVPEFNRMYLDCSSMLVLNSHMGNWELSGGIEEYNYSSETFAVKPEDFVVAYKKLSSSFFDKIMAVVRCGPLEDTAFDGYTESSMMLRHAFIHRDERKFYVFNIDQYPYWKAAGCDIGGFMNQPTKAMTGAAALAVKFGMAVVYLRWEKREGGYDVTFVPITENASEMTPLQIMRTYYDLIEEDLRRQPWNYLWSHKRWK